MSARLQDGSCDSAWQLGRGWGLDAIAKTEAEMQPRATGSNQAWDVWDVEFKVKQM